MGEPGLVHSTILRRLAIAFAIVCGPLASAVVAQDPQGGARLKDVATLQGPSSTPLIGYGLVVGLNKTGDRRQTVFSAQTLANMLERFGVAVRPGEIKIENVAAVLVTTDHQTQLAGGLK